VATAEVQQIQFALAIADGMRRNTQEMKDNIVEFMCCFCNYFLRKIRNRFIMIMITTGTCLSFSKLATGIPQRTGDKLKPHQRRCRRLECSTNSM